MKILFAISILLVLGVAQARQPAVLPVRGISIEEIDPIPPNQAKQTGYTFTNKTGQAQTTTIPPSQKQSEQNSVAWTLAFFALALPLIGLPILLRRREIESTYPDNMIFLDDRRALREQDKTEENKVDKAS